MVFRLVKSGPCWGSRVFSGTATVKLGRVGVGLFSLGQFIASKFVFKNCSSADTERQKHMFRRQLVQKKDQSCTN